MKKLPILLLCVCSLAAMAQSNVQKRDSLASGIYSLATGSLQEAAYKNFIQKYPAADSIGYQLNDELCTYIALTFALENNVAKAESFMTHLHSGFATANRYFRLARICNERDNLTQAEKYARLAIDSSMPYLHQNIIGAAGSPAPPQSVLAASALLLANVYCRLKKYDAALDCLSTTIPYCSQKDAAGLLLRTGDIATDAGKHKQALETYAALLKYGNETEELKSKMRIAYAALHTEESNGFDDYYNELVHGFRKRFMDSLRFSSLREKAPFFKLKDADGNTANLTDYLGKVLVLDFWATWCTPCKASFPAMQMAVNKYKSNPDVVFLFIDTWEYTDAPQKNVQAYLQSKNYLFTVLYDLKDEATGEFAAVKGYGVKGVPAKFIIDKNGYIRFKLSGFNGNDASSLEELSFMIDTALDSKM